MTSGAEKRARIRRNRITEECRHFHGIRVAKCEAGVVYRDVWGDGAPRALPCLAIPGKCERLDTCDKYDPLTEEEVEAREREIERRVEEMIAKLKANICPVCDRPIRARARQGRCVYAVPCGHRLGQAMRKEHKP